MRDLSAEASDRFRICSEMPKKANNMWSFFGCSKSEIQLGQLSGTIALLHHSRTSARNCAI
jgi:hypothetical protein